jgi:hypothetical protein
MSSRRLRPPATVAAFPTGLGRVDAVNLAGVEPKQSGEPGERGIMIGTEYRKFHGIGAAMVAILLPPGSARAGKGTAPYFFSGGSAGLAPASGLIPDSHGNLYSTTYAGGASDAGSDNPGTRRRSCRGFTRT